MTPRAREESVSSTVRGIKEPWGDGVDSDPLLGQVPGQGEGHAHYGPLASRVSSLAHLTIKSSHTSSVYHHPSLVIIVRLISTHHPHCQPDHVEGAAHVHHLNPVEIVQAMGFVLVEVVDLEGHTNTSTVNCCIETTKLGLGLQQSIFHIQRVGNISWNKDTVVTVDSSSNSSPLRGWEVNHRHLGSLSYKPFHSGNCIFVPHPKG